ncbi:hypothetical protein [Gimesia fumaroli]|uniref:Uncharacterized protein n=1 Tax=Gimesia fumaroli TaxID=2527976 RepID=A0A518I8E3_9PLAN|nr:hypothetical protein [Gimesia fumaroli]QDV49365.1 hypothetical protein Enr17x_13820 [Gimesia fumaroli]
MSNYVELESADAGPFRCRGIAAICMFGTLALMACTGFQQVVPAPLVFEEQSQKILEIVPMGTQKEQAIQRLNAAGISGGFSSSPSIYYCDLWEREDGSRWHLNVALLFNEAGTLYKTRPAQADVSWQSTTDSADKTKAARQ